MLPFLARRTLAALVLAFVVASSGLLLARFAQGDFAEVSLGLGASREQIENVRRQHGLDRPVIEHYSHWMADVVRLDFGRSMSYGLPVGPLVADRAVNSSILACGALLFACGFGIPLGVLSGSRRGMLPHVVRAISVTCLSVPPLIASLLLVWLAAATGLFPVGGMSSSGAEVTAVAWLGDLLWHLPVPVAALALPMAAMLERVQSQAMARALGEPSVAAALARGASRARVVWVHALRLSAGAPIAVGGLLAGVLLSGSLAVELVTGWPGLGRLTFEALKARDVPLVAGCATAAALLVSVGLIASDVLLALNDRRVLDVPGSAATRDVRAGAA